MGLIPYAAVAAGVGMDARPARRPAHDRVKSVRDAFLHQYKAFIPLFCISQTS